MSDINDLNNDTNKAATDLMHPDGGGGPVKAGLPGQPTSRPAGYESSTEGTGVPNGVAADDLAGGADTRRTLGQWLTQQTDYNITPAPTTSVLGDGTIDTNSNNHKFHNPSTIGTVYSDDPDNELGIERLDDQQKPYGPRGNANTLLKDVTGVANDGAYLDPGSTAAGSTDVGRVSRVLSRNRFQPGDSFTRLNEGNVVQRRTVGSPQKFKGTVAESTLGKYDSSLDGMALSQLQLVAEQLLLNAVGDKTSGFGEKGEATTDFGAGSALPFGNSTQLGRGRSNFNADVDFRPANAIQAAISGDRKKTDNINGVMATVDNIVEDINDNKDYIRTSYGVLNNPLEPFSPGLPVSMILLAAVGALASLIVALLIAVILDVLGVLVSLAGGTIPPVNGLVPAPTYQILGDGDPDPAMLPFGSAFGFNDYGNGDFFDALSKWLNIPPLEYEYKPAWITCLLATASGALEFFIGNTLNSKVRIPQIATNAAGFYVTVIRNAMRDQEQISEAFDNMGDAGPIEGFFALIDAFTSSSTFKFVTTLMQIGDRVLCGPGLFGLRDNDGRIFNKILPENAPGRVSIVNLHSSVRRKSDSPRLAYSFTSLPQVFIRPKEEYDRFAKGGLPITRDKVGQVEQIGRSVNGALPELVAAIEETDVLFGESISVNSGDASLPFMNRLSYVTDGRIPTRFREDMESLLDSYYVPFYFHDLRTNEIMPLPAFVDSISDSFSPSWNEQKGFGRADPVQIYGGTSRKIGFSFYMVATNKQDYSALYYGINKLVSMVYPQWGGGQHIKNAAGQSFKKPFSMVQTSSPLIRIRLGELFASNRTTETVRRLFGANERGFQMGVGEDGVSIQPTFADPPVNRAELDKVLGRSKDDIQPSAHTLIIATGIMSAGGVVNDMFNFAGCDDQGQGGALTMSGESFLLPVGTIIKCSKGNYSGALWNGTSWKIKSNKKFKFKDVAVLKITNYAIKGSKGRTAAERNGGHLKNKIYYVCQPVDGDAAPDMADAITYTTEIYDNTEEKIDDVSFSGVAVPIKDAWSFQPTIPTGIIIPPFPPPEPPPTPIYDDSFFDNNLIVDAMRESGGAGLAGAITSLDFDWNQATWETDPGLGRAPQWVKVTIGFNPIHDEPLGLNPDGSLRAAAYPVGTLFTKVFGPRNSLPGTLGNSLVLRMAHIKAAIGAVTVNNNNAEVGDEGASTGEELD